MSKKRYIFQVIEGKYNKNYPVDLMVIDRITTTCINSSQLLSIVLKKEEAEVKKLKCKLIDTELNQDIKIAFAKECYLIDFLKGKKDPLIHVQEAMKNKMVISYLKGTKVFNKHDDFNSYEYIRRVLMGVRKFEEKDKRFNKGVINNEQRSI